MDDQRLLKEFGRLRSLKPKVFIRPYAYPGIQEYHPNTNPPVFAKKIPSPEFRWDCLTEDQSPWEEQAYRRGFDQGYNAAIVDGGKRLDKIHQWRIRLIQIMGSPPGSDETIIHPRLVTPRLRYQIMLRDGHRCQLCKSDGPLEIDHKIPISKGGGNEEENLWTLCFECNRGKSTDDASNT